MIKRTAILRRTPLRRVSKKRAKQNREYTQKRKAFLSGRPICEACNKARSCDVHHARGRLGGEFLNMNSWMAVCRPCHDAIHTNPSAARARGWLI